MGLNYLIIWFKLAKLELLIVHCTYIVVLGTDVWRISFKWPLGEEAASVVSTSCTEYLIKVNAGNSIEKIN